MGPTGCKNFPSPQSSISQSPKKVCSSSGFRRFQVSISPLPIAEPSDRLRFLPFVMANAEILRREDEIPPVSIFDAQKGEIVSSRGQLIERKIDALESLAGKVSNRRSRKWLNDRLLIELVPRLKVEEIRGLFAPPPWGDDTPLSAFCMTNVGEWDAFRNIDMDKEASLIQGLETSSTRRKGHVDSDKMAALNAWHRVDCRTREALRRSSLFDLVERFEDRIRSFIRGTVDGDTLVLHVQDPLHRLLLHGVCEFYGLTSVTVSTSKNMKLWKMMKIKKKLGSREITPDLTLVGFLKMTKNGVF